MKIVSRLDEDEEQLQRLRKIIEILTDGAIAVHGEMAPGKELPELVTQIDAVCCALVDVLDRLESKCQSLIADNMQLSVLLEEQEKVLTILQEVQYDEDLDHVTTDLMDGFLGSGAAEPTFDGEIAFQTDVPFSREDLKPLVRETIGNWLRLKIR
jgi:hypothetical protein